MHEVGFNAKLLRDQAGNNTEFWTNSITLGGGESLDVILDASDAGCSSYMGTGCAQKLYPAGSTFYVSTSNLDTLSNDAELGTHPYYSGTQGDLQVEMGLYGAVVVLPASVPANCDSGYHALITTAKLHWGKPDFRLAHAAYDHPGSCYDREYLFQWAEMDSRIHKQAEAQVTAKVGCAAGMIGCSLDVQTEPYHPAYFLINGRSMPDLMDPNYASECPHQPYNRNPHTHPGDLLLIRSIG